MMAVTESRIVLRDYQASAVEAILESVAAGHNPICRLPTGCHAKGQGILMYDGRIKSVEEIVVGDLIMGPDSMPRTVLNLCRGFGHMFDIIPIKGEPWRVNKDHVVTLVKTRISNKNDFPSCRGGEIMDMPVNLYMDQSKWFKHLHKMFRVWVNFPDLDVPLPIDPYCLGVFLGDGSTAYRSGMHITNSDPYVRLAFKMLAEEWGLVYYESKDNRCVAVRRHKIGRKDNPINNIIIAMGISGVKKENLFVPTNYKVSSRHERLEFLAGIIDTDGHLHNNGYDWLSKSKQLADDVVFMARSVGLWATAPREKWVTGYELPYWRVSISGNTDIVPCRVPRKISSPRKQIKDSSRTGFEIKHVYKMDDYYGFTLDGDGRYLLDDFTVTHNSGKSIVIADLCTRLDGRILVVTHRKELLEQNEAKLAGMGRSDLGVYSAGLSRREMDARVIFGGVQSIYKRMDRLQEADPFRYLIVDEAHTISEVDTSGNSMYKRVIESCRELEGMIGLTATPYRLTRGVNKPIFGLSDSWFDHLAIDIGMIELVKQGWLAPPRGLRTASQVDISGVKITGDDYNTAQLSEALSNDEIVDLAVSEICRLASDRKSWLIFCVDIAHAEAVQASMAREGIDASLVAGATPPKQRRAILEGFKAGGIRCVINVGVLTTGFDAPRIDMIGLIRPTKSKSLLVQMIGRGSRLSPETGKVDCLVLDLAGNLDEHLPLDGMPAFEEKPKAEPVVTERVVATSPWDVGARTLRHGTTASELDPLAEYESNDGQWIRLRVLGMSYKLKPANKYPGRENLMAIYRCQTEQGVSKNVVKFVLFQYPGRPGLDAQDWLKRRGMALGQDIHPPYLLRAAYRASTPKYIIVEKKGQWDELIEEIF